VSRISTTFEKLAREGRKALIPYVTAGDPSPAHTVPLMHALAAAGADVIELGVPFSDPMADGPVIQRASERALAQHMGLDRVLACVAEFRRRDSSTPVVLMGYANPIEAMGAQVFAERARAAGVDGVLVVDYPPEESADFAALAQVHGMDMIFLLAPTSTEARIAEVVRLASGYIYYVSLKGVTGAATLDVAQVAARIADIRRHTRLPLGVGFGIRDAASARAVAEVADAVVIGSKIISEMEEAGPERAVERARQFLAGIRDALDSLPRNAAGKVA
jgi:tryptophan synthase alpha chain